MKYSELFGIPFWHGNIKNNEEFKSSLVPIMKSSIGDETQTPEAWATDKLITSFNNKGDVNDKILSSEKGQELVKIYWDCVNGIMTNEWTGDMQAFWFNYYEDGEWQEQHHHVDCRDRVDFVFVHFLSFDKTKHKPIIFHDPLDVLKANTLNHMISTKFIPELNEGDWVIFPSYLCHSVPKQPSTPDYPRITISWNIQITSFKFDS